MKRLWAFIILYSFTVMAAPLYAITLDSSTPTKKPLVGVGVLILNDNNEILLGKRKGSHGAATWAVAGGHMEFGESIEDCAKREVLEETGLKIQNPQFVAVTNDFFASEQKHYLTVFMKVQFPKEQFVQNLEPNKLEEWKWFKLDALPKELFLSLEHLIQKQCYGIGLSHCEIG